MAHYNNVFLKEDDNTINKDNLCIGITYKNDAITVKYLMYECNDEQRLRCKENFGTGRAILEKGIYEYYHKQNFNLVKLSDSATVYDNETKHAYELSAILMMERGITYYEGNGFLFSSINNDIDYYELFNLYLNNLLPARQRILETEISLLSKPINDIFSYIVSLYNLEEQTNINFTESIFNRYKNSVSSLNEFIYEEILDTTITIRDLFKPHGLIYNNYHILYGVIFDIIKSVEHEIFRSIITGYQILYINYFYKAILDMTEDSKEGKIHELNHLLNRFAEYNIHAVNSLFTKLLVEKLNPSTEFERLKSNNITRLAHNATAVRGGAITAARSSDNLHTLTQGETSKHLASTPANNNISKLNNFLKSNGVKDTTSLIQIIKDSKLMNVMKNYIKLVELKDKRNINEAADFDSKYTNIKYIDSSTKEPETIVNGGGKKRTKKNKRNSKKRRAKYYTKKTM